MDLGKKFCQAKNDWGPHTYLLSTAPSASPEKITFFLPKLGVFFFDLIFLSQELNEKLSCNRVEIIRDPSPLSPKESPGWSVSWLNLHMF